MRQPVVKFNPVAGSLRIDLSPGCGISVDYPRNMPRRSRSIARASNWHRTMSLYPESQVAKTASFDAALVDFRLGPHERLRVRVGFR